ncbi:MAG: hypothetical protein E7142_07855 [Rikenellaceae bacterium]|nr:hypothetical protein [Rikenellaceae bacterium]
MTITLLLIILISFSACSHEDQTPIPYLSITLEDGGELNERMINIPDSGDMVNIIVNSNSPWQAECAAEWVDISSTSGTGDGIIRLSIDHAEKSRSTVVAIHLTEYAQIKSSFDIIQHVSTPETPPSEDNPLQPDDTPDDTPEQKPNDTPNEEPNEEPKDNPEEEENTQKGKYIEINKLSQLSAGEYYIGGYQDGALHLATGDMHIGHCRTSRYTIAEDGDLVTSESYAAATVTLEAATENGYYIRFDGGYLSATAAGAGKLVLTSDKSKYWLFSTHANGGFVVRQQGDIDVQIIISPKAKDGALLRSVAGEEEGNAIVLFRKNE